ncbi:MAG: CRISPR-associated protein Cas4 [Acidobacteriota bacterium]|nr:CRISPR-associated protein Cas4 [Blastocatellia bacterium]MDW8241523.1 CRISPR-associated protein Cas4 [Acidobacteriota bacterium]
MNREDYILISALNQFDYCPRRCYLIYCEGEFFDNEHTVEGSILHARADEPSAIRRGDTTQFRSVWLYSERHGLYGKADVIEERDGKIYPVEIKKGRRGDWKNDQLQLCAQALCLEEMIGCEPIEVGYIYYAATARRQAVKLDAEIRRHTILTIEAVRSLLMTQERPPAVYGPRCKGCSLYPICLPRETEKLVRLTISNSVTGG